MGIIIFSITIFLVANTYYDGKYFEKLKTWTKYYKMILIGVIGYATWLCVTKSSEGASHVLRHANKFIKYMPLDNDTSNLLAPLLDMSNKDMAPQTKRMLQSTGTSGKRSLGETKKKYVAAQQGWKCKKCNQTLQAWFEVDHVQALENGGSNELTNLVALCRNCHGEKTAMDRML